MKTYTYKKHWKYSLLLIAMLIGIASLWYTNNLVKQMATEERKKIELWATAIKLISGDNISNDANNFYLQILQNNTTIPVILTNEEDSIVSHMNFTLPEKNTEKFLRKKLNHMKQEREPIVVSVYGSEKNYVYYEDSSILRQLATYPYIQLTLIAFFIAIAYYAFSTSRKAEQNQVWVGMSKETAHQLGTPISSLMAWVEILATHPENEAYVTEIEKDVNRLETIAERFSKIGSVPDLKPMNLSKSLQSAIEYMKKRSSSNISFLLDIQNEVSVKLNSALFNWVIENLIKNSIDAMNGRGEISFTLFETAKDAVLLVIDNGKGIPRAKHKTIFKPGYTSKERGWGLGLSLAKRIIENYHGGRIFVLESEINEGTTIKITLPKHPLT